MQTLSGTPDLYNKVQPVRLAVWLPMKSHFGALCVLCLVPIVRVVSVGVVMPALIAADFIARS